MIINPNTDKSLQELLELFSEQLFTALNCLKIGKIISFDKTKQTCDVEVLHKRKNIYVVNRDELLNYPKLCNVPVVIMGGGSSYITHPISAGDTCLLLFNDYQLDGWKATGNAEKSGIQRKHDISDAIAIVGLNALPNAIQGYSDYLDLHYSDNSSIIVGDRIQLNNPIVEASGSVDVTGTVTAASVKPADGYSGVVYCGTSILTFANGILVSVQP